MQTRYVETGWGILFGENKNFILRCFTTTRYRTDSARKQNGNELIGKKDQSRQRSETKTNKNVESSSIYKKWRCSANCMI